MNLNDKDLNMLVLFEKIWEERNLHRAAEKLCISQPALSHALKRMREQFDDPMFVRSSKGVAPTEFAVSIADEVKAILDQTEKLYGKGSAFNIKSCDRTLNLAFGDYFALSLLQSFFAKVEKEAPHLKVVCYPDSYIYEGKNFEQGILHLGITGFFDVDLNQGFHSEILVDDQISCVCRKNHPIFKTPCKLDDYLEWDHVFVSVEGGSSGVVDSELKKQGKARRVSKVVPSFAAAAELMKKTDVILTGPEAICQSMVTTHKLKCFPSPLKKMAFPVNLYWHQRTEMDPLMIWAREALKEVAQSKGE